MAYRDCNGFPLAKGDRVGVAFSSGRSNQGSIRTGEILFLEPGNFVVLWDKPRTPGSSRVSPQMAFNPDRMVKL